MSLNRLPSIFGTQKGPAPPSNAAPPNTTQETGSKVLQNFRDTVKKGLPISLDTSTLASIVDAIRHTEAIDDRKMLLEHVLVLLSRLPEQSVLAKKLQNATVELLYNDLGHPPATYIGSKYAWRAADGSNNNISDPDMGKAGTPYARSVQQTHAIPQNSLPDPGLVFDTLLKREGFVKHPAGLSSMMFSFAALVIHSVFRTSHYDVNINETSSYVDLSPLYGHNQEAQDKVRIRDGRGTLYPDVFAEDRLLLLPPAVCVILVLFSRNHNYIAKKLLEINERGTYVDPTTLSSDDPQQKKKLLAQEEELFQTARLINCAWFASVVFSDSFSCILGLVRDGSSWSLNPFGEIRNADHSFFERGKGNVCSVEFNCLYRWHATTSEADEKWVEQIFGQIFQGKSPESITPTDFKMAAVKMQAMEPDVTHWTFGNMQRQADGTFKDDDLASALHNATEHPAAAFRARGTPAVMRLHEVMGIEQNRKWGVCSLNDFRRFLGLKAYESFKEWNPNPEIYDAAEKLYGNIENLELYVGLQAEEAKPVVEGAGLCPGYTISRAILSDAIALTRGDRFYTADYTPFNMTAWGFADCQRDPAGFGFGSTLGRLFLRTLPNNYTENSVYTWFPLMTPDSMKTNLTKMDVINQYSLERPVTQTTPREVTGYAEIAQILKSTDGFKTPYGSRAAKVITGNGFFIASEDAARAAKEQREVLAALVDTPEAANKIAQYFYQKTKEVIAEASFTQVGGKTKGVDIVRDVLRFIPLHWAATELAGIQLKTTSHPHGDYTPQELYEIIGEIYSYIFLETEPAKIMVLQQRVKGHIEKLLEQITDNLGASGGQRLSIAGLVDTISQIFTGPKKNGRQDIIKRLYDIGQSSDQLANSILAIIVGATVELSLSLTNAVNLYIGASNSDVKSLSTTAGAKALEGLVYEAIRLDPAFQGVYRIATKNQTVGSLTIKQGERLFLNIGGTSKNEQAFPDPTTVVPSRPVASYLVGDGATKCLGDKLAIKIKGEVFRAIFELPGVRRAPGQSGQLTRFKETSQPILRFSYLDSHQFAVPWPTSMAIQYDVTN
jgi:linoleate 10R-lipoxygenase